MTMNALNINQKELLDTISKWKGKFPSKSTEFDDAVIKCYEVIWWKKQMALFDPKVLMPPPPPRAPKLDPGIAAAASIITNMASDPPQQVADEGLDDQEIKQMADRLQTDPNLWKSPEIKFEVDRYVGIVKWENPDEQALRVQTWSRDELEKKMKVFLKKFEQHQNKYQDTVKALRSAAPAMKKRLQIQAAIAVYAKWFAMVCLDNMQAVLDSLDEAGASGSGKMEEVSTTPADDEMEEDSASGSGAMQTESSGSRLRTVPALFTDFEIPIDEGKLYNVLELHDIDYETIDRLLNNTLGDVELERVLWFLYIDAE
jgi:hypothetical protein